jgi:hypothetical protein
VTVKRLARVLTVTAVSLAVACTGKPRPAQVKDQGFEPDTSGNVVYMQKTPTTTRTVVNKDYAIATRKVATVGEPMFSVRNYTAADHVIGAVALQPFKQLCRSPNPGETNYDKLACRSGRLAQLQARAHDRFDVAGSFIDAGKGYYLVKIPASGGNLYIASDTSGRVKPGRYAAWAPDDVAETPAGIPLRWQDTPVPFQVEGPVFRYETQESLAPEGSKFVHYELLYKGTTYDYRGMVYHLLYREYRRENPSLPLYEQDLEFAGSVTTVDVLGLRIRVEDVNDNQIVYTVMSD